MITGTVNASREAIISCTVRGPVGQQREIEAGDRYGLQWLPDVAPGRYRGPRLAQAAWGESCWQMVARNASISTKQS